MLERGNEVIGELKPTAMLAVTIGFEQDRGVTWCEQAESDDTIASL
jgi:hypothetical protein